MIPRAAVKRSAPERARPPARARKRGAPFVYVRTVRFGETDTAGIVYTAEIPRYALEALEDWFVERLGVSWFEINRRHEFGTPFVHMSFDMREPLTPAARLEVSVLLEKAGRSSLTLLTEGRSAGKLCFVGRFVTVFAAPEHDRSIPIPERCRAGVDSELAIAARRPAADRNSSA